MSATKKAGEDPRPGRGGTGVGFDLAGIDALGRFQVPVIIAGDDHRLVKELRAQCLENPIWSPTTSAIRPAGARHCASCSPTASAASARVHRLLLAEAIKLQRSVFLLHGEPRQTNRLLREAATLLDHDSDDLRSYRIASPDSLWLAGDTPGLDAGGMVFADERGFLHRLKALFSHE